MIDKQRFLADDTDWSLVGGSDIDGIAFRVYSNPCPAPEHKGLFHMMAEVVDFRIPKRPVQINLVPVGMPEYAEDAHYFVNDLEAVAADFLHNVQRSRDESGTYDMFIRGLYMAPLAEVYNDLMGKDVLAETFGQRQNDLGLGGSQDDVDATDLLGGFDLNSILQ